MDIKKIRRMAQFFATVPVVVAADAISNIQANSDSQVTNSSNNSTINPQESDQILTIMLPVIFGSFAVLFFVGLALILRKMHKDDPDKVVDEANEPVRHGCCR